MLLEKISDIHSFFIHSFVINQLVSQQTLIQHLPCDKCILGTGDQECTNSLANIKHLLCFRLWAWHGEQSD